MTKITWNENLWLYELRNAGKLIASATYLKELKELALAQMTCQ